MIYQTRQSQAVYDKRSLSHTKARPSAASTPLQFGFAGGALGAFSWSVDLLEKRAIELTVTDFLGMCVPRSYVEYKQRGWDSARENVIRETTAMIFNVFVAGWMSVAMLKLLTNRVGKLNPIGMNHQAWLDVGALEIYINQIYRDVLKRPDVKTPHDAEVAFTREILSRLQSTGTLASKKTAQHITQNALQDNPQLQKTILAKMPLNGKLTPEAVEMLTKYLNQPFDNVAGKSDFMGQARARVDTYRGYPGVKPHEELYVERMNLSKALLGLPEKRFISIIDPLAKQAGLSANVNLLAPDGKVILANRNRTTTLKQIRYSLHEILNRAHYTEDGLPLKGNDPQWKEKALHALYKPRGTSFIQKLLPTAHDGLMDYVLKSERITTVLPLALTIASAISIAFLNNYITKKRHGGKVFSPIEEGLRDKMQISIAQGKKPSPYDPQNKMRITSTSSNASGPQLTKGPQDRMQIMSGPMKPRTPRKEEVNV